MKLKVSVRVVAQDNYQEPVVAEVELSRGVAELVGVPRADSLDRRGVSVLRERASEALRSLSRDLDAQFDVLEDAARERARRAGIEES